MKKRYGCLRKGSLGALCIFLIFAFFCSSLADFFGGNFVRWRIRFFASTVLNARVMEIWGAEEMGTYEVRYVSMQLPDGGRISLWGEISPWFFMLPQDQIDVMGIGSNDFHVVVFDANNPSEDGKNHRFIPCQYGGPVRFGFWNDIEELSCSSETSVRYMGMKHADGRIYLFAGLPAQFHTLGKFLEQYDVIEKMMEDLPVFPEFVVVNVPNQKKCHISRILHTPHPDDLVYRYR